MKELLDWDGPEDSDLEARLLAMIMGEASAFEVEALERLMEERPEVAVRKRRLELMHGLVGEAARPGEDDWKLSPERRARVRRALGIGTGGNGESAAERERGGAGASVEARIQRASRRVLWAAAACVMVNVILFSWLVATLSSGRKAESTMAARTLVTYDAEMPPKEESAGLAGGRKRSKSVRAAGELLPEGREADAEGDYDRAVEKYEESLSRLPEGLSTEKRPKARATPGEALKRDPDHPLVREQLENLDDPVRSSEGLTYERAKGSEVVRRNLDRAEGEKNLGLYDRATERYLETLRADPENAAARRGMGMVQQLKSDYYRSAYDETRARLLSEVDAGWESAVPPVREEGLEDASGEVREGVESIRQKQKIVIPELELEDVTVAEAVDLLREKTRELDTFELDPSRKGVNLVVQEPERDGPTDDAELDAGGILPAADPGAERIKHLKLKDVPLEEALEQIAEQANLEVEVDEFAVKLAPKSLALGDDIVTRRWAVGKDFVRQLEAAARDDAEADPFGGDAGGASLRPRRAVSDLLKELGIDSPPGSSVQFLPSTGTLVVSSTPENLERVEKFTSEVLPALPEVRLDENLFKRRGGGSEKEPSAAERMGYRTRNIIIPVVDFENTTVEEAVDFLRQRARELDSLELDSTMKGINITLADAAEGDPGKRVIRELKLRSVPLQTVLDYVCEQAGLRYRVDENGIRILDRGGGLDEELVTREWEVHPDVMEEVRSWDDEALDDPDPFGEPMTASEREAVRRRMADRPLREVLMDSGIEFRAGASVRYDPARKLLTVVNTPANQDLVDRLFESVAIEMSKQEERDPQEPEAGLEVSAAQVPFSTFSLHVSDVSFKLAKAALETGEWPAPGQIRVEEFVNAFDYGDPPATQREKVACRIEQAGHPFLQQRNLLRLSMRTAAVGRSAGTPLGLTVLLDHSGSMERLDRAESVRRAFELLAAQLGSDDRVTLISFARTPRLLADRIPGDEVATLVEVVAGTPSGGGTNLEEALRLGIAKAREHRVGDGQNRIILLTDGAANLGNARPAELARMVERMRQMGIAFDACGVGADGLNDEILESLTRKGDGRYYFLDRAEDADAGFARQVAGALRPAARNVKVQVRFNPQRVGRYRLFGFDKHRLKKEDFRDDRVDAAELAAEEAGTAVYQVEALPDGAGAIGVVSVRFQDVASGEMVERRWVIPYDPGAPRLEDAAPSMRLAGSAALLGEKLDGSVPGERVRLGELAPIVHSLQSDYPASERVREFVRMTRQARELSGE